AGCPSPAAQVEESSRLRPLLLRKVALREALGSDPLRANVNQLLRKLLQPVQLQEPTLKAAAAKELLRGALAPDAPVTAPRARPPVHIRIYRDLPLPTWQLSMPDKRLQFRPLDLLRTDTFALVGLVALLAQARYDSLLLDLVTLLSASVFVLRIALGFKRMDDRYRNQVAEVLRGKTIASDATALEYLATSAALQQFKQ
ncbi:uncharacterized protein HaLaN_04834, partial [Haematococcus lacustris]